MDVSKIAIPGYGEPLNIKDAYARTKIAETTVLTKENISPLSAVFLNFEIGASPTYNRIFYTQNGYDLYCLMDLPKVYGRNSVLWFYNDYILKADYWDNSSIGTGTIQFMTSKNFIDWKTQIITIPEITQNQWTNPGNFFEYNNKLYYSFFVSDPTQPIKNKLGWGFSTYIAELNAENPEDIKITSVIKRNPSSMPNIDPFVFIDNNELYMLYKDDGSNDTGDGNSHIYYRKMDSGFNFITNQTEISCFKYNGVNAAEAPSLLINTNYVENKLPKYFLYADIYTGDVNIHPGGGMVVASGNDINNLTNNGLINRTNYPCRAGGVLQLNKFPKLIEILSQFRKIDQTETIIYSNVPDMIENNILKLKYGNEIAYLINTNSTIRKIEGLGKGNVAYIILPSTNNMLLYPSDGSLKLPNNVASLYLGNTNSERLITIKRSNFDDTYYIDVDFTRNISYTFTSMDPLYLAVSGDIGNAYYLELFYNDNREDALFLNSFYFHNGSKAEHEIISCNNKLTIDYVKRVDTSYDILKITPITQYTNISINLIGNVSLLNIPYNE